MKKIEFRLQLANFQLNFVFQKIQPDLGVGAYAQEMFTVGARFYAGLH